MSRWTDKTGNTVTLLSSPQSAEFMHLNGTAEALVSLSIPQGIYTAATANIGYSYFTCVTLIPPTGNPPGGLLTHIFAYGYTPSSQVKVTLSAPITVTGNSMGLLLNMMVSQSASFGSCYDPAGTTPAYSITPTFSVTAARSAEESGLNGEVSSVNAGASSFTLLLADGQTLSVTTSKSTAYQGVPDLSAIIPGMLVTSDATLQSDGSQVARRIAVPDVSTSNISDLIGPVLQTNPSGPTGSGPSAVVLGPQQQGFLAANHGAAVWMPYNIGGANFQISGALPNLGSLPFVPSFNSSNVVAGQNVYVTTESTSVGTPGYIPANTVTLVPQTINATVSSVSTSGAFQDYTVTLAPYSLFPTLAVQQGQPVLLSNPGVVEVYLDNTTQRLNTQPLAPGSILRFYGLVFNDNGTLRMDCAQVNDGIIALSQASSTSGLTAGQVRTSYRSFGRGSQQVTTVMDDPAKP